MYFDTELIIKLIPGLATGRQLLVHARVGMYKTMDGTDAVDFVCSLFSTSEADSLGPVTLCTCCWSVQTGKTSAV
jgi:hypothetical protein